MTVVALTLQSQVLPAEVAARIVRRLIEVDADAHPVDVLAVIEREAPGVLVDQQAAAVVLVELAMLAALACQRAGDVRAAWLAVGESVDRRVGAIVEGVRGHAS